MRHVVGDAEGLERTALEVSDFRRLTDIEDGASTRCEVQIRHRSAAAPATLVVHGARARITFDAPVRAVAPGQAAVAYAGTQVLGGGWIEGAQ